MTPVLRSSSGDVPNLMTDEPAELPAAVAADASSLSYAGVAVLPVC